MEEKILAAIAVASACVSAPALATTLYQWSGTSNIVEELLTSNLSASPLTLVNGKTFYADIYVGGVDPSQVAVYGLVTYRTDDWEFGRIIGGGQGFVERAATPLKTGHWQFAYTAIDPPIDYNRRYTNSKSALTGAEILPRPFGGVAPFQWTITISDVGIVPEPSTWGMMLVGFGIAGAIMRKRKLVMA